MAVYWTYLLGSNLAAFDTETGQWRSEDARLELHLNTAFSPWRVGDSEERTTHGRATIEAATRSFGGTILSIEGR